MPTLTTRLVDVRGQPMLAPVWQVDVDTLLAFGEKAPTQTTVLRYTETDALRKWYWGVVTVAAEALGIAKSDLHSQLKFKAGLIRSYLLGATGPVVELGSIARTEINKRDLEEYMAHAFEVLFSHYLDGAKREDVYREVERRGYPRP